MPTYNFDIEPGGTDDSDVGKTVTASYLNAVTGNIEAHTHNTGSGDGGTLANVPQTLLLDSATVTVSDGDVSTVIASATIPGNTLGRHGRIDIECLINLDNIRAAPTTVNSLNFALTYGGTVVVSMTTEVWKGTIAGRGIMLRGGLTSSQSDTQKQSGWLNLDIAVASGPSGGFSWSNNGHVFAVGSAAEDSTTNLTLFLELKYADVAGQNQTVTVEHRMFENHV